MSQWLIRHPVSDIGHGIWPTNLALPQERKQLAALDKVHYHVQILRILEGTPQGDQERMLDLLQHPPLVVGVFDLLHLDDLLLFQDLDGIES